MEKFKNGAGKFQTESAASKAVLEEIGKMKDISVSELEKRKSEMSAALTKMNAATKSMDDLRGELEKALEKAKKAP